MTSTLHAAPVRAALKTIVLAALACTLMLALAAPPASASGRAAHSACANRLCTKDRPEAKSCWHLDGRKRVARCFIARAAAHYGQPKGRAYYIAWRESRYNWRVTNPSSGTAGLYQFARGTWKSTPYRHHSPYQPRWAALAAMWMWAHGGYSHWRV
jgi:soluble lytic murein transglycosylase-like protein